MNARIGLVKGWLLQVATALVFAAAAPAAAATGKAEVRSVIDAAQFTDDHGVWRPLEAGVVLHSGTKLKTGINSQVALFLGERGGTLILAAGTTLEIEGLKIHGPPDQPASETRLNLRAGTIVGTVAKMAEASQYEVKTPQTICAVKSRDGVIAFQVSADGRHVVRAGAIIVAFVQPKIASRSLPISAGQTYLPPVADAVNPVPTVRPTQPSDLVKLLPGGPER